MYTFGVEIILYYPDENAFRNISRYQELFDWVLIFDNTPKKDINYHLIEKEGTTYFSKGLNFGMSTALHNGVIWAKKNKIDFLLTMDQDSLYDEKNIQIAKDCIEKSNDSNIAIFAPNYRKILYKDNVPTFLKTRYKKDADKDINCCMTSGSFMRVKIIEQVLPLNNLFIGFVDNDLCYKLRERGFKIHLISNSILSQHVGQNVKSTFFNRLLHKVILSKERYFFMGRNSEYLKKSIHSLKIKTEIIMIQYRIFVNLFLCEINKKEKISEWIKGRKKWNTLEHSYTENKLDE